MEREEVELCFNCEIEIEKPWDVEKQGYQIECPNCREKILLCSACLASEDNKEKYCDWTMENGCFRKRKESGK